MKLSTDSYERDPQAQARANVYMMRQAAMHSATSPRLRHGEQCYHNGRAVGMAEALDAFAAEAAAAPTVAITKPVPSPVRRFDRWSDIAIGLVIIGIFAAGVACTIIALTMKAWL